MPTAPRLVASRTLPLTFIEWTVGTVKKLNNQKGFAVVPKRWIVERVLAWLTKNRRLSKDNAFQPNSSEAIVRWAVIGRMTRWLERHTA